MALEISNQYLYTGRGPFDSKSLVKTYTDLLSGTNWIGENGKSTAYNGMVVSVWLNEDDTAKNGIYYLHDSTVTSTFKAPNVANETNWHKLASLSDIAGLEEQITTLVSGVAANTDKLAGIETTVVELINEKLSTLSNIDLSEYAKISDVETYVNTLIDAADPEGGKTITNIQNLVKFVDENADEVARLITNTSDNAAAIAKHTSDIATLESAVAAIRQPKESEEISVAADGTLGVKELNVNKLVQTVGDTFIISGGTAKT